MSCACSAESARIETNKRPTAFAWQKPCPSRSPRWLGTGRCFVGPLPARSVGSPAAHRGRHSGRDGRKEKQILMSKRLFVGNLSFDVTEEELRQAFEPYG